MKGSLPFEWLLPSASLRPGAAKFTLVWNFILSSLVFRIRYCRYSHTLRHRFRNKLCKHWVIYSNSLSPHNNFLVFTAQLQMSIIAQQILNSSFVFHSLIFCRPFHKLDDSEYKSKPFLSLSLCLFLSHPVHTQRPSSNDPPISGSLIISSFILTQRTPVLLKILEIAAVPEYRGF